MQHKKLVSVTAVHPGARFGELELSDISVKSFKEKPQTKQGWINGGFFIIQPEFIDFIKDDTTVLEAEPLELASAKNELAAYQHEGFWQCMDNSRDKNYLDGLWAKNQAPWRIW